MCKKSGAYEDGKRDRKYGEKKNASFVNIQIEMLSGLLSGDEKVRGLVFGVDVDKSLRNYGR